MASSRDSRIDQIADTLGDVRLIWFGIRGEDGAPLFALPQFAETYAVTAPMPSASLRVNRSLEAENGRVDLDDYDIDHDDSDELIKMRRELLASLHSPSAIVPYRPSEFLSSLWFANIDSCRMLGLFHDRQRAFDHKPWVESNLTRLGIPTLDWKYIADEDHLKVVRELDDGPIVLRASRTSGGVGIVRLDAAENLEMSWPRRREAFVSVSRFLGEAVPLNVSGCVFADGRTTVHPPSVQLIGLPAATKRQFGYCGNDFAAAKRLDPATLKDIDRIVQSVGTWLAEMGYLGAFGVDLLCDGAQPRLTEINPRFQGSSMLSAEIATRLDVADLYLDHVAAFLGLPATEGPSVGEWAADQPELAHVVCHNVTDSSLVWTDDDAMIVDDGRVDLIPARSVEVRPNAVTGRLVFPNAVTDDGFTVSPETTSRLTAYAANFLPVS